MSDMEEVTYHSQDFTFEDLAAEYELQYSGIPIQPIETNEVTKKGLETDWNHFYSNKKYAYQLRHYIYLEFLSFFNNPQVKVVSEVGCGHGSTMFPLLSKLPHIQYIATDYSDVALNMLSTLAAKEIESNRVVTSLWDIATDPACTQFSDRCDLVLSIFVLSAIDPSQHVSSLRHLSSALRPGGRVLLRDYALYDMTAFRHRRLAEHTFARQDGTLCTYFSLESLSRAARDAGLLVEEASYACVRNVNRKTGAVLKRYV